MKSYSSIKDLVFDTVHKTHGKIKYDSTERVPGLILPDERPIYECLDLKLRSCDRGYIDFEISGQQTLKFKSEVLGREGEFCRIGFLNSRDKTPITCLISDIIIDA